MKTEHYDRRMRMREAIADSPVLLMALSRFNIPLGFGDDSIETVCEKAGVDTDTFIAVASVIGGKEVPRASISLPTLIAYLKNAHSYFIDFHLPAIRRKLIDAINCAGGEAVTLVILRFFDDYVEEVKRHMSYEDSRVFTYVESLLEGVRKGDFSIDRFLANHDPIATKLHELKDIFICHYHGQGADINRLNSVLFDIMNCEVDLMSHCEVENVLFTPAVRDLEKSIESSQAEEEEESAGDDEDTADIDPEVHNLTEREKEIVRNIARGLSNKEIANLLCVSVYTVATHRRNICAKLDIHSAAGLTIFAIIHKLVDVNEVRNGSLN